MSNDVPFLETDIAEDLRYEQVAVFDIFQDSEFRVREVMYTCAFIKL